LDEAVKAIPPSEKSRLAVAWNCTPLERRWHAWARRGIKARMEEGNDAAASVAAESDEGGDAQGLPGGDVGGDH
jgi:hypothetical protein